MEQYENFKKEFGTFCEKIKNDLIRIEEEIRKFSEELDDYKIQILKIQPRSLLSPPKEQIQSDGIHEMDSNLEGEFEDDNFKIRIDVSEFSEEDVFVLVENNKLIINAKQKNGNSELNFELQLLHGFKIRERKTFRYRWDIISRRKIIEYRGKTAFDKIK
ncbi:uncharacterized protein LOC111632105 [Centruroides sculpturatus]|uniref:uncharacterized protein LOC111632105 n=1 Tax=Centruroides sculpturatus TaxID=218467 RepID=UPI000C6D4690|nr:uncharacterized protein LOC111632105 [Centruroides sculpturatus]